MTEHSTKSTRPPPPSWLNQEFIQTALRTGDNDPTITVLSCDFSMANAAGDGYLSNMYRAIAKLPGGEERRLVIKCQPQGGKQEEVAKDLLAYEKETKMFSEILPAMQNILAKIGIHQQLSAKCLYHGTDPIPFIVLEDLRWSGFTLADRIKGLDMDHCRLVVKAHALFHASSLSLYEKNPSALEFFRGTVYNDGFREVFEPMLVNHFGELEETVLKWPGYERFAEKLKRASKKLYNRMQEESECKEDKLNTLLHADTWTNNIMFKYKNNVVEDVRLLDFQLCYISSPCIDLQTFLTGCPNEDARDDMDSLLKEYHTTLVDTTQKLKCKTRIPKFEEFKNDFDGHSIFGLSYLFGIAFIMSEVPKTMKVDDLVSRESSVKLMEDVANNEVYQRVMKKLLVKFENLGVL